MSTSPYNLQNYKKIFIYTLFKQELRKFFVILCKKNAPAELARVHFFKTMKVCFEVP